MNTNEYSATDLAQDQLAIRYGLNQGMVSAILRRYDVPITGHYMCPTTKCTKRLYNEKEAVYAFERYYHDRADELRRKAQELDDIGHAFVEQYERHYTLERSVKWE